MSARKTKGFTLIELLVVIAIIAILAAILFPVFAKAREKARQSQCMSNMKNSALALRMYSSDYDEKLPFGIPVGAMAPCTTAGGWCYLTSSGTFNRCTTDYSCGWSQESQAYIKNSQVLLCPNWNKVTLVGNPLANNAVNNYYPTTYMLSGCLVGASEAEIGNASNKAMLYEILPFHHDATVAATAAANSLAEGGQGVDNASPKPNMLVMVGFADGHTKIVNMNQALGTVATVCNGNAGAQGSINGSNPNNAANYAMGTLPGGTKWNLNTGWDPGTPAGTNICTQGGNNPWTNSSPFGLTGRGGSNF